MNREPARLCFIGNMLGKNADYPTTQGQVVAGLFSSEGYEVTCVSSKINKIARLCEIAVTLITGCRKFDAVLLDVYSGFYFFVADVVSLICKVLAIPLIAVLHGGQLAEFGRRFPGWTKRVFNRTDAMVAPSHFLAKEIGTLGYQVQVIPNVIDWIFILIARDTRSCPILSGCEVFIRSITRKWRSRFLQNCEKLNPRQL